MTPWCTHCQVEKVCTGGCLVHVAPWRNPINSAHTKIGVFHGIHFLCACLHSSRYNYIFFVVVMYVCYMSLGVTQYEKCTQVKNTFIGKHIGTRKSWIIHLFMLYWSPYKSCAVLGSPLGQFSLLFGQFVCQEPHTRMRCLQCHIYPCNFPIIHEHVYYGFIITERSISLKDDNGSFKSTLQRCSSYGLSCASLLDRLGNICQRFR